MSQLYYDRDYIDLDDWLAFYIFTFFCLFYYLYTSSNIYLFSECWIQRFLYV